MRKTESGDFMGKKYETIMSWFHQQIENGELRRGTKLPSEHELTEQFQMSRQTVRRALSALEERGEVERRRGSGTYVAATVKIPGKTRTVAVLLTYIDTYIFPSIMKGIEAVLSDSSITLQIAVTDNSIEKERIHLQEFLRSKNIDGLIAETVKSALPNPNLSLYEAIQREGIPVLFLNSFYRELDIPHISLDDQKAGYLAARHLLECGHRRIGGIFKADDGQGHLRYAGYMKALMEYDIPISGSRILWLDSEEIREIDGEGERIRKRLSGCTACVCYNDEIACRLVRILEDKGIHVPQNMSVVGIDDSSLARLGSVPLTSVKNPAEELGRTAARSMSGAVCYKEKLQTMELEPELVMRSSVRVFHEV